MTVLDTGNRKRPATTAERTTPPDRRAARDAAAADLFARLGHYTADQPQFVELRERIAAHYLGMARALASRYRGRGEPAEDVEQAALLGLVKAINGFDAELGYDFVAYAIPMMIGEIKRHFRDKTWSVRVPRRHKERRAELHAAERALTHELGRSPTTPELAEALGMSHGGVVELAAASAAYSALSLDAPVNDDDGGSATLGDSIGAPDAELEGVVDRQALPGLLRSLPDRERRIVLLRFFGNMTQSEIAERVGMSQMHVSRLLGLALRRMRRALQADE